MLFEVSTPFFFLQNLDPHNKENSDVKLVMNFSAFPTCGLIDSYAVSGLEELKMYQLFQSCKAETKIV